MKRLKVFIVTSVYNEETEIVTLLNKLIKLGFKNIIVVDDGSTDKTCEIVTPFKNVILAKHIFNRGAGAGIQTGNEIALNNGAELIVNIDGDGQHDPKDIKKAVDLLVKKNLDMVLGSRYLGVNNQVPFIKKIFVHKIGRIFTLLVSRINLTDNHNGFRVMTATTARKLNIRHDRYEYCSEVQDKLRVLKLKFAEIPVTVKYTKANQDKTTNKPWNAIGIVFKFLMSKIL